LVTLLLLVGNLAFIIVLIIKILIEIGVVVLTFSTNITLFSSDHWIPLYAAIPLLITLIVGGVSVKMRNKSTAVLVQILLSHAHLPVHGMECLLGFESYDRGDIWDTGDCFRLRSL
jgi:hypothetical protein